MYLHITRLDASSLDLADSEMEALMRVIESYRPFIPIEDLKSFEARVAREWAIETGQIEGLYQFDRGVTLSLLEDGIAPSRIPTTASKMSSEQVAAILGDHVTTLEGLFTFVKGERKLSKSYIHELHQALLRNQSHHTVLASVTNTFFEKELLKGQYKKDPNSPTRPDGSILEFCPPEQVDSEMENLIQFHREHEAENVPIEIRTAWLHHAFTHIHPYADGNGRVARALATLVLIRGGLMPLVVPTTEKQQTYIPALEKADHGNYTDLVAAIRRWQGRLIVQLSQQVRFGEPPRRATNLDEFFDSVHQDLLRNGMAMPEEWKRVDHLLKALQKWGVRRFAEVSANLTSRANPDAAHWQYGQGEGGLNALELALLSGDDFILSGEQTAILQMKTKEPVDLCLTIANIGPKRRGLGIAAVVLRKKKVELSSRVGHPFMVSFQESEDDAVGRFAVWFNKVVLDGLEQWRQLQFEN